MKVNDLNLLILCFIFFPEKTKLISSKGRETLYQNLLLLKFVCNHPTRLKNENKKYDSGWLNTVLYNVFKQLDHTTQKVIF